MSKAITCDVILTGCSTRVDGSLSIRIATPELDAASKTAFFELLNQNLKMLLQPVDSEGGPAALHDVKNKFEERTPSVRLRSCIYCLWKHLTDTHKIEVSFDFYYRDVVNRFCDNIKEQLPEQH